MLGLAFQGQGQLDMAFDKFRKAPLDDEVMDNLYNLGPRLRAQAPVQQGREPCSATWPTYNPKFRDLGRAPRPREEAVGNRHPRRRAVRAHQRRHHDHAGQRRRGKADARPLPDREGTRQGRDGRGLSAARTRRSAASSRSRPWRCRRSSRPTSWRKSRSASSAKPRPPGASTTPTSSRSTMRARSTTCATSPWNSSRARTWCPTRKPEPAACPTRCSPSSRAWPRRWATRTRMNVVHRDIKPANIMYEPESDTVKVTDFGIARITDSSQDQDRHGAGHAVLHVAGAARRQEDRRQARPVLARRDAVPDALRAAAVRGRFDGAAHVQDRQRTRTRASSSSTRRCRRGSRA